MKVRWTPRAGRDVDSIKAYIAERKVAAAARVTGRIVDMVEHLAEAPHRGRPGRVDGTRELVITRTPYIVAYRVIGHEAQVLRVLHAAQQWPESI